MNSLRGMPLIIFFPISRRRKNVKQWVTNRLVIISSESTLACSIAICLTMPRHTRSM